MTVQNLKTKVIGPALLLIPMACMHLGDGHHDGDHHSSVRQQSVQSLAHDQQLSGGKGQGEIIIGQGSGTQNL